MFPSSNLGENAVLLHLPIESPQETLEALPFLKLYLSHMIASFHAPRGTAQFVYFSQLEVICQGSGDNNRSLLRVADYLYLVFSISISGISSKKGIA